MLVGEALMREGPGLLLIPGEEGAEVSFPVRSLFLSPCFPD